MIAYERSHAKPAGPRLTGEEILRRHAQKLARKDAS